MMGGEEGVWGGLDLPPDEGRKVNGGGLRKGGRWGGLRSTSR